MPIFLAAGISGAEAAFFLKTCVGVCIDEHFG